MNLVVYYRSTSTKPPSRQRPSVQSFIDQHRHTVVEEHVERADAKGYPALQRAITACKQTQSTLLISNLGKLAISSRFTAVLQKAEIDFFAHDNPNFNKVNIDFLAVNARKFAIQTGRKVRDKRAKSKAAGVVYSYQHGVKNLKKGPKVAAKMRRQETEDYYANIMPLIEQLREDGYSLWKIAHHLNSEGYLTTQSKPFTDVAVMRLIRRYKRELCQS